jgi:hypothetical protein
MIRRCDFALGGFGDARRNSEKRRARPDDRLRHRVRTERAGQVAEAIDLFRRDHADAEPEMVAWERICLCCARSLKPKSSE